MKVLVACEFSGVVRDAFTRYGHTAWSCDLLPTEKDGNHHQGDVLEFIKKTGKWDLMIAHPPCQYLNHAGVRWLYIDGRKENGKDQERWRLMRKAAAFYNALKAVNIPRIAIENSEMHPYAIELCGWPDQMVQPWMFGEPETKCISWQLKNLPHLIETKVVEERAPRVHYESPGPDRWKNRSRFLHGVADAIAQQWGSAAYQRTAKRRSAHHG